MKIRLGRWPGLILLGLLLGGYVLMGRAADSAVPKGAALQIWPPLHGDLRALGLDPAQVRAGVHVVGSTAAPGGGLIPSSAEYMVYGVKAGRLNLPAGWRDQGVPARPEARWGGPWKTRPGRPRGCAQQLGVILSPGQHVETAELAWTEGTAPAQTWVSLRVWRASATVLPSVARDRVCVQSSRVPLRP